MKKLMMVILAFAVLCCNVAVADTIDVVYNNIQVYINGSLTEFTDSNGNDVEPFIYNGNVYLPLPAVAEAMDVGYSWDGSTMSAYLGAQPGESQYLLDVCPPYQTGGVNLFTSSEGSSFDMAGRSFTNGLKFKNTGNDKFVLFNLNGQFSKMKFTLGHVDGESMEDVTLQIYLDGKLAGEYLIPAEGLPQEYTLDLKNALSMKISGKGWLHYSGMAEITVE